jgi:hypothetical protein
MLVHCVRKGLIYLLAARYHHGMLIHTCIHDPVKFVIPLTEIAAINYKLVE